MLEAWQCCAELHSNSALAGLIYSRAVWASCFCGRRGIAGAPCPASSPQRHQPQSHQTLQLHPMESTFEAPAANRVAMLANHSGRAPASVKSDISCNERHVTSTLPQNLLLACEGLHWEPLVEFGLHNLMFSCQPSTQHASAHTWMLSVFGQHAAMHER